MEVNYGKLNGFIQIKNKTPKVCILSSSYNTRISTITFEKVPVMITLTLEQWMGSSLFSDDSMFTVELLFQIPKSSYCDKNGCWCSVTWKNKGRKSRITKLRCQSSSTKINWILVVRSTIDRYFMHHHVNETSCIIRHQYQLWTQKEITFC
jgi:hypothetical protein